ncbi:hypothetical protein [Metabacillus schmidteae]|uniref:hypothetical protein n=1 Tax=Metabacillus schmidteae TaxID=2730405 RepID=UPI00158E8FBD|nr:hypothetical protein [Metabacillus schmidteae]
MKKDSYQLDIPMDLSNQLDQLAEEIGMSKNAIILLSLYSFREMVNNEGFSVIGILVPPEGDDKFRLQCYLPNGLKEDLFNIALQHFNFTKINWIVKLALNTFICNLTYSKTKVFTGLIDPRFRIHN